ncbi:monocyte chemotactic protein 1B-like isoform X2 [Podarcis raffonei]|uniref:monocyte chemotactic protein 1B-like isoform X2 n=1 Tax=Podarcis raffonei TaxID=65483 RepID=UPI0023297CC4|nr:monocyte chemotactic protein 1B-like isoform X2 [Podarcis raffonei]
MKTSGAALIFLLLVAIPSVVSKNSCCVTYAKKPFPKHQITDYWYLTYPCKRDAIVFKFKNGKLGCANPDDEWVHDLVAHVDKLYERPSPGNYRPLRRKRNP